MIRAILRVYGAFAAVRYPVSLIVALIALAYGGMTQLGWVTRYDELWWIGPNELFVGVYLAVAFVGIALWMHFVGGPRARMRAQYALRWMFRATDTAGTRVFSALVLISIGVAAFFLWRYGSYHRDILVFFALLAGGPFLFDFLPQRRRRMVLMRDAETLDELLDILGFELDHPQRERAVRALRAYNRDIGSQAFHDRLWADLSAPLHEYAGVMLEMPPVLHELRWEGVGRDIVFDDDPPPPPPPAEEPAPPDVDATAASEAVAPPPASDEAGDVVPEKIGTPKDGEGKLWN
jgi:hypothetical protein